MSNITIRNVKKCFGDTVVLRDFTQEFREGEFITLLGPSGCGKTTMLRMIAGFERPTQGEIAIGEQVVSSKKVFIPPEKRDIGMVFQSYAVWPHMTVFDNVAYPLRIKKLPKGEVEHRVEALLQVVHLGRYAQRMPGQLSGGQQQRVALARALVMNPRLLLLDEPLSNLDAKLREGMRYEIKEIQRELGITVVYVTHDQTEAMAMSDRIVVINRGVIQQVGTPQEIYRTPANQFVADFVGRVDFLRGAVRGGRIQLTGLGQSLRYDGPCTGEVVVAVRPESLSLARPGEGQLTGSIVNKYYLGDISDLRVDVGGAVIRLIAPPEICDTMERGAQVALGIREFLVFPDDGTGESLRILT
ncbi:MAG: ABC transporter ATP-binding protein [Angelakisella sp.]|nr:ABC transporter ATP-binding protein [Angelakisella sp.]